jgi:hypothetical protein
MSTRLPVDSGGLSAATVEIYKIIAHGWGDRTNNVRYWHKADISTVAAYVRFRGKSGHRQTQPQMI